MLEESVSIPTKFCGPAQSGNGGYSSGLLADVIEGACEVTLRAPPPLAVPLVRARGPQGGAILKHGETLLAEAIPGAFELELPEPVGLDEAERASTRYVGYTNHPYPSCFVCSPTRPRGDGLAIHAGPVGDRRVVAGSWWATRDLCSDGAIVDARFVWAALDCPSWFGFSTFADDVPPILLGRLAVTILRRPKLEERCVVMGWSSGREGRRIACGSQLLNAAGDCLAYAKSTWVILKQSAQ
ncbi:MAG TPA: hypothetical protein VJV78_31170 [Polyangiales bacterium]|nr:hypothetical protein [Polyangiales bacterium]